MTLAFAVSQSEVQAKMSLDFQRLEGSDCKFELSFQKDGAVETVEVIFANRSLWSELAGSVSVVILR